MNIRFFLSISFLFLQCQSANIIVYMSMPFYSHQVAFKPLWLELAKRGHKITLIQSNVIIEDNENITYIVLNETYSRMNQNGLLDKHAEGQSMINLMLTVVDTMFKALEYQLTHPGVQNLLNGSHNVDLFFTEYIGAFGFALGSKFKVPMIGITSMDASTFSHATMGNPTHPIMYPDKDLQVSPVLTFKDRVVSSIYWFSLNLIKDWLLIRKQERLIQTSLGDVGPLEGIMKNVSLMFINANPLFNIVRPLTPTTINIGGGFNLLEPQPLPQDLQEYLDNAEEGVIYLSLGSNINSKQIPNTTKTVILETFAQLPYKILWKLEEEPIGMPQNVKVVKWVPQQDLLRHKNVKLFITQGGLQSMEEAIFNYVPMVALPFYGDQPNNANKMAARGFGLTLDYTKMTVETLKAAILEVINNPRYKERTKQLADLIKDQPMTGLEKAVWWTEYLLRHGHTNILRNPSIDIPWYQYLFLDVIPFIIMLVLTMIYFFFKAVKILSWTIRKLWNILTKRKTKTS